MIIVSATQLKSFDSLKRQQKAMLVELVITTVIIIISKYIFIIIDY